MSISVFFVGQDYERISYAYIDTEMRNRASHVKGNWQKFRYYLNF